MAIKVNIISLGCAKNLVDSEQMAAALTDAGMILTDLSDADVAVVNTCGFIEDAQKEGIDTILSLGELKKTGALKAIVAAGCLTQRFKDEFHSELPEVDAVLGTGSYDNIVDAVNAAYSGKYLEKFSDIKSAPLSGKRIIMTSPYSAYLKIAEGCSNFCSYCIIPKLRGPYRSRPIEEITEEAREMCESGVREIIVIAQDVSRYGIDLYGENRLRELLKSLCSIKELRWLRLHYLYPEEISDELLEFIAGEKKVLRYFDIPFQHINDDILRKMNRKGGEQAVRRVVGKIRELMPDAVIRTSLIVGFPGETDEQFTELYDFLAKEKLERAGVFVFSPEEGTPAALMEGRVDFETAEARRQKIYDLQTGIMEEKSRSLIGSTMEVLCCGFDEEGRAFGRTFMDSPEIDGVVYFPDKVDEGKIIMTKIVSADGCDLVAEPMEE